jgi:hypothetical protein
VTLLDRRNARANALDVRIEQERQLTTHYEARAARAEATAAAVVTAVFALAALTATVPAARKNIDKGYAWTIVILLALACGSALVARTTAGLRRGRTSWLSSSSKEFEEGIRRLREWNPINLDPLDVRQRTLTLCVARAKDAHSTATSKDRATAFACLMLVAALIAILGQRLAT